MQLVMTLLVGALLAAVAPAQDFGTFLGSSARQGVPTLAPSTPGGTNPNVYNDFGRGFLRWWDPTDSSLASIDNDSAGTAGLPVGTWQQPNALAAAVAALAVRTPGQPAYRYNFTTVATSTTDPTAGATATYSWTFNGLVAGQDYSVSVNIPVGPTDISPGTLDLRYSQKFYVYRISGVVGGPYVQVVDVDAANGLVRLGDNGNQTSVVYQPVANQIVIELLNTTPLDTDGTTLDPNANVGNELVYADAAQIAGQGPLGGRYNAQPIVAELTATPPIGGPVQFPRRVYASRIEETFIGALNDTYDFTVLTSHTYNSERVDLPGNFGTQNIAFSWPIFRPQATTQAQLAAYAQAKRDWLQGPVPANPSIRRADQRVLADNLSGGSSFSGPFAADITIPGFRGEFGMLSPVSTTPPTLGDVTFRPYLVPDTYQIDLLLPSAPQANLARGVTIQIFQGATVIDTVNINQANATGWVRLPSPGGLGYDSLPTAPLGVRVLNTSNQPDAGRFVWADSARFVRKADVSIKSTPVFDNTTVNVPAPTNRDVVVVANESGRLFCIDAHGDPNTSNVPQTYWTYPTENPAADPNGVTAEDGNGNVAEAPVGFLASSAAVANVGGEDLLYIAARNGKVFCLEMDGRGDGTTTRRWTFPDDYDPTNPSTPMQPGLPGDFQGSVATGTVGGNPAVFLPTPEGRIYALDAAGNAASKTTTVLWAYPPTAGTPLGPVDSTPVFVNNRVYFTSTKAQTGPDRNVGMVTCLDANTGTVIWQREDTNFGLLTQFAPFNNSSPLFVDGTQITGPGGAFIGVDSVFVMDSAGHFASLNATTGADQFRTFELADAPAGNLGFIYGTVYDNAGVLQQNVPMVMVPTGTGRIVGLLCDGAVNRQGNRSVWGFTASSSLNVGVAAGGWNPTDIHSWMYAGDADGYLYAFNSIDDNLPFPITPGVPPGTPDISENDPNFENAEINPANFVLITPEQFAILNQAIESGTLTQAQIDTAKAAAAQRREFEFGETLYVLIDQLPVLSGPANNYSVMLRLSSSGGGQNNRVPIQAIQPVLYNAGNSKVVLAQLPLLPTGGFPAVAGKNFLRARMLVNAGGGGSQEVALPKPPSYPVDPTWDFYVANPLGVITLDNAFNLFFSAGNTIDASNIMALRNGSLGTDQFPTPDGTDVRPNAPLTAVGPEKTAKFEPVSHGAQGLSEVVVVDRSLMTLLNGRGLPGVRVEPYDHAWRNDGSATGGVYKPLTANAGVNYPLLEDYPTQSPNRSLDYPDVRRENLSVAKELNGETENPLFSQVTLNQPTYTAADFNTYRGTGYDLQLNRALQPTQFDLFLGVPRYQPPSNLGYRAEHVVYVDNGQNGFQGASSESYRSFLLQLNVAVDEKVAIAQPVVDLGSLPIGAGFNGGAGFTPAAPWGATNFSPWNIAFRTGPNGQFSPFGVLNEGNVNLLNLRVAKGINNGVGIIPFQLGGSGLHQMAWFDAYHHMHSNLDPRWAAPATLVGAGVDGFDSLGRVILQKARPGDAAPTRLNVNPVRRSNAFLRAAQGNLFDTTVVPEGDPVVSVSVPVGAPSGLYSRPIFVIEDNAADTQTVTGIQQPVLAGETFTDPGLNLRFTVREARMTNTNTSRTSPMVENVLPPGAPYQWASNTPTAFRYEDGQLNMVFSSNRRDGGGLPGWLSSIRSAADMANQETSHLYFTSLLQGPVAVGFGPIRDFSNFAPQAGQWFDQRTGPYPNVALDPLFGLAAPITAQNGTERFDYPVFPAGGAYDMLVPPLTTGRPALSEVTLAFRGRVNVLETGTRPREASLIFAAEVDATTNAPGAPVAIPDDLFTIKSRPTVIQTGANAAVFYTSSSSGGPAIKFSSTANGGWQRARSLSLTNVFEELGAPTAYLRRYQQDDPQIELFFTGTLRGRQNSEVYMARVDTEGNGMPDNDGDLDAFPTRIERLQTDVATGKLWTPGLLWRLEQRDIRRTSPTAIDVFRQDNTGALISIIAPGTEFNVNAEQGLIRADSTLGGEIIIDTRTGAITLSGGIIPRNVPLFARYRPAVLRVTTGQGVNYRSASTVFDDRFLGVVQTPGNPDLTHLADLAYWFNPIGGAPGINDPIRWDRTMLAFTRTSNDGSTVTRPYMMSLRPGIILPTPVATDANGAILNLTITFSGGPASERYYQVDPGTGRIFFLAGMEDRLVSVTYQGVDASGNAIPGTINYSETVGPIIEQVEAPVPIDQVGSETSLSLALEPLGPNWNTDLLRRPTLYWMFWTSTRSGNPDVYFQTLAPRFSPRPAGN